MVDYRHAPGIYVVQPQADEPPLLAELDTRDGYWWQRFGSDERWDCVESHILAGPFTVEQILGWAQAKGDKTE